MNDARRAYVKGVLAELLAFVKNEAPVTEIRARCYVWLQLGPYLFLKIKPCNDAICVGLKFEAYSTLAVLPGSLWTTKCTQHTNHIRYHGIIERVRLYGSDQNAPVLLRCKEFVLRLLQRFTDYREGPYRRSAERVSVSNLLD
jgi:hypothetical protein